MIYLPETVAAGIYNSHAAVKNKMVTDNRRTTMFEIEIPLESGGESFINSACMPIERDMIICAKPGQLRCTRLPYKCYYVHMIVNEGMLYDVLMDIPDFVKIAKTDKYISLYERMFTLYESGLENDEIMLGSIVLELIYNLSEDSKRIDVRWNTKRSNKKTIEAVIAYIKSNLTQELSLETISSYAGFSPIHFHNCFKASTGKTLHDYVEEQRIKKAENMLITTDYTLTRIAYECGFSSQSYFGYVFRKRKNMTPREYAKNIFRRYETE